MYKGIYTYVRELTLSIYIHVHIVSPIVSGCIYDFYPTSCVFFIPEPWRGDRKHSTSWIKIIANPKPWEILFITYLIFLLTTVRIRSQFTRGPSTWLKYCRYDVKLYPINQSINPK